MRAVLVVTGYSEGFREILTRRSAEFDERFAKAAAELIACLAGFEDAIAVMALPEKYRK